VDEPLGHRRPVLCGTHRPIEIGAVGEVELGGQVAETQEDLAALERDDDLEG
jgi:hypothetical protein